MGLSPRKDLRASDPEVLSEFASEDSAATPRRTPLADPDPFEGYPSEQFAAPAPTPPAELDPFEGYPSEQSATPSRTPPAEPDPFEGFPSEQPDAPSLPIVASASQSPQSAARPAERTLAERARGAATEPRPPGPSAARPEKRFVPVRRTKTLLAAAVVAVALGIPVIWLLNSRSAPVPDAAVAPLPQERSGPGDPVAPLQPPAQPIPDSTITAGTAPLTADDAVQKPSDEGTGVAPRAERATGTASAAVSTSPSPSLVTTQSLLEGPAPPNSVTPPPSPQRSVAIDAVPPLPNAGRGQPAAERSDARQAADTSPPSGATRESSPPPVKPTPPQAPTSEAAAAPPGADEEVRAVISQYRSAYERLDAGFLKYVWPSVDEGALVRAFDNLESQDLDFKQCGINASGSSAVVTCSGIARYVRRIGNRTPQAEPREWTFTLRRVDGTWEIERVSVR
jgi:hypothetical protein